VGSDRSKGLAIHVTLTETEPGQEQDDDDDVEEDVVDVEVGGGEKGGAAVVGCGNCAECKS
jgi:hypothetical protein